MHVVYKNLEIARAETSIEGIIFQRYEFRGQTLYVSAYNPKSGKYFIAPDFNSTFREVENFSELKFILYSLDKSLG